MKEMKMATMKVITWIGSVVYVVMSAALGWWLWTSPSLEFREGLEHEGKLLIIGVCIIMAGTPTMAVWSYYHKVKKWRKKSKECSFLVVYQLETDGEICIAEMTRDEISEMAQGQPDDALAIFEGRCLKTFDDKFDYKILC